MRDQPAGRRALNATCQARMSGTDGGRWKPARATSVNPAATSHERTAATLGYHQLKRLWSAAKLATARRGDSKVSRTEIGSNTVSVPPGERVSRIRSRAA